MTLFTLVYRVFLFVICCMVFHVKLMYNLVKNTINFVWPIHLVDYSVDQTSAILCVNLLRIKERTEHLK